MPAHLTSNQLEARFVAYSVAGCQLQVPSPISKPALYAQSCHAAIWPCMQATPVSTYHTRAAVVLYSYCSYCCLRTGIYTLQVPTQLLPNGSWRLMHSSITSSMVLQQYSRPLPLLKYILQQHTNSEQKRKNRNHQKETIILSTLPKKKFVVLQ